MSTRRAFVVAVCLTLPTVVVFGQGLTPQEAVQRMKLPDGFDVQPVANEPLVRQPVCIEFDDRGRLWVIQYLQYPNPAGLNRVQVDRYSRTEYDRVPKPPPRGPRGADRITILEDSDGDGLMDSGRDFVDGLNLASGIAFGHGGVFVLNVPYLLFYPDKDRNDVPDSDPEVLLTGFGMNDAHSVANSLTWGPDGWLYGCQGSTVTARIRGIEFQQGVWRYHPLTHEFELFCEGGGNAWGLDFDGVGNLLYSTNYGGFVLVHGVQGGYYVKSFAKHGALHNSHTYGYFNHAPHQGFHGGHVTVGGIVYQGDSFPDSFRGKYIAGDLLGHGVYWHNVEQDGSTFRTSHGGELLVANDSWFAPTDVTMGPDGAIYVSDWHDARTAHPDPDADWDRSNGRIYRIAAKGTKSAKPIDFAKLSINDLLNLHSHRSQWYVRHARQELARRRDRSAAKSLRDASMNSSDETAALEALWSLNAVGDLDEVTALKLLDSPHPAVRSWTLRLLGAPGREVSEPMAHRLDEFAEQEPAIAVRQQLACTTARLPAHQAIPIINANINRDIDNDDPYLPLLWWWAVERHSVGGRDEVMRRFVRPSLWKSHLGRETLLTRLIRRYVAEGTIEGLDAVSQLVKAAPTNSARHTLWSPILQGWQERPRRQSDDAWKELSRHHELSTLVFKYWQAQPKDLVLQQLGIMFGHQEPLEAAMRDALNPETAVAQRVAILGMFAEAGDGKSLEFLYSVVTSDAPEAVRIAALRTAGRAPDDRLKASLIDLHRKSDSAALNSQIRDILLSRQESALAWLMAVDRGDVPASSTSLEQIRRVAFFDDPNIDSLVTKHWGKLQGASRGERLAEVRRLNNDLRAAAGNADVGKGLFKTHCASCHQLFGEGTKLGPDLTTANRADRNYLLVNLVDPSSVIRKEFVNLIVQTTDGRVLTGLPVARNDAGLTLVNAKNERLNVTAGDIAELRESPVSMMPDDLYRKLKPQELRDLFAYLQSKGR
ncbi:MAG: c-type cytochrome [Planctomycetes bacterium]|nr:c-type cytochrome [Planctomycetota bacterium]